MLSVVLNICYVLLRFDPYLLCCPVRFSGCQLGWRTGDAGHQRNWICSWQISSIHLNPETNHLLFTSFLLLSNKELLHQPCENSSRPDVCTITLAPTARSFLVLVEVCDESERSGSMSSGPSWKVAGQSGYIWIYELYHMRIRYHPYSSIIIHCIFPISGWESHIELNPLSSDYHIPFPHDTEGEILYPQTIGLVQLSPAKNHATVVSTASWTMAFAAILLWSCAFEGWVLWWIKLMGCFLLAKWAAAVNPGPQVNRWKHRLEMPWASLSNVANQHMTYYTSGPVFLSMP